MNIESMKLLLENGEKDLKDISDVRVFADENGKLFISAQSTRVRKIILTFEMKFSKQVKILGDAFERGYGTFAWKSPDTSCLPWYFLAKTEEKIFGCGVKTQPNAFCYWKIEDSGLCFTADIGSGGNGLVLDGRTLEVCQFVTAEYEGDSFDNKITFHGLRHSFTANFDDILPHLINL